MILSMFKSFGRSLWHFFVRPAPTSVALMVGEMPSAANEDQAQLLRRAMRAASQPEVEPAFETTVVERKLTIAAAPVEDALAEDEAVEDAAAIEDAASEAGEARAFAEEDEPVEEAENEEISPEGGIDKETDGAALVSMSNDEEPAREADEMAFADDEDVLEEKPVEVVEAFADVEEDTSESDDCGTPEEPADEEPTVTAWAAFDDDDDETAVADDGDGLAEDTPVLDALTESKVDVDEPETDEEAEVCADQADDETGFEPAAAEAFGEENDTVESAETVEAEPLAGEPLALTALTDDPDASDDGFDPEVVNDDDLGEAEPSQTALLETSEAAASDSEEAAVASAEGEVAAITSEEPAPEPVEEVPAKKARKKRASSPRTKKSSTKSSSRKNKSKAKEPVPEDDVWVSDAVLWSLSGEWTDEWHAPEDLDCPQRLEELRELAAEGKLTIWGRSDEDAPWQAIAPSYWKQGYVEPASLAEGRENVVADPKSKRKTARKYSALKVSKSQIEEIWQPGAMH